MSDMHYGYPRVAVSENFKKTMRFLYDYADGEAYKNIDALYIVGDYTNTTLREQHKMLANDCREVLRDGTILRVMMANHDLHYLPEPLDYHDAEGYFREFFDMPFDDHLVINGYHFISMSGTFGTFWHDAYTPEKLAFVKNAMDEAVAENPNKPIFTFQHVGVYGANKSGTDCGYAMLMDFYKDYPQVVNFSGHSHSAVNAPEEIDQTHFTTLNTGLMAGKNACCLLVEVDERGTVRVRKVDAASQAFFEDDWVLDEPWNPSKYSYTKARAESAPTPYFEDGTTIGIEKVDDGVKLTIPRAKCEGERFHGYTVQVVDEDDAELSKLKVDSGARRIVMPDEVSCVVKELPDVKHRFKITAVGYWDKLSAPIYTDWQEK